MKSFHLLTIKLLTATLLLKRGHVECLTVFASIQLPGVPCWFVNDINISHNLLFSLGGFPGCWYTGKRVLSQPRQWQGPEPGQWQWGGTRDLTCVLIWWSCHNKIPQTGWLKQQTLISHSSGGWHVQDQDCGRFSSRGLSFWLTDGHLLVVSSRGRQRALESLVLLLRALIPSWGLHLHDLIWF